jgi:hypothetical protein
MVGAVKWLSKEDAASPPPDGVRWLASRPLRRTPPPNPMDPKRKRPQPHARNSDFHPTEESATNTRSPEEEAVFRRPRLNGKR